ncbi:MAG: hypothetical protein M0R70_05645 [Nitrospirae bacterium]|nr:hypothetical protein [Nitrospirota bacterium]
MTLISRDDYDKIIRAQLDGKLTIMIDTSAWRQFLDKADPQKLKALVNCPVRGQITLLRLLSRIDILLLLYCAGLSISAFGWWAAAIGPLTLIAGLFYRSRASIGRQSLVGVTIFLVLAIIAVAYQTSWTLSIKTLILSVAITFFLIRFLYVFTSRFVFSLIHSSYQFFSQFYLQPAENVGDIVIPLIWTEPAYEMSTQE